MDPGGVAAISRWLSEQSAGSESALLEWTPEGSQPLAGG